MVRTLFAAWLLLILALSLMPFKLKLSFTIGRWHNAGHFLVFLVAAVLGCWRVRDVSSRLWRVLALVGLAIAIETGEKLATIRNPFEWGDLALDAAGVLCGLLLSLVLPWRAAIPDESARLR
jgi:hypothetical protein